MARRDRGMNKSVKTGFTLVELSLSIVLIAVLSIIVISMINNAVSAYHRGLILNQVNTVGMGLVDDMRSAVQSSPGRFDYESECQSAYEGTGNETALNNCVNDKGRKFMLIRRYATVWRGGTKLGEDAPVFGAFCTGEYSYIWNSGYFFNTDDFAVQTSASIRGKTKLVFRNSGGTYQTVSDFKLLKIKDENRAVCKLAAGAGASTPVYWSDLQAETSLNSDTVFNFEAACKSVSNLSAEICGAMDENTLDTELIGENLGYGGLALYDLSAQAAASSAGTNNLFYSASFILGTLQGGINVMASGNYCVTPGDYNNSAVENFDYCAVNKFNFAAQASGG